jgi:hypothetical protein
MIMEPVTLCALARKVCQNRRWSWFAAPAVPITVMPRSRAICSTADPTPPDAPLTSSVCPGRTPTSRMIRSAVSTTEGYPAASSNVRPSGIRAQARSTANSA